MLRRLLFVILLGIVLLVGCNSDLSLSLTEKSDGSLSKDIQSFFHDVNEQNGVHLYFDNQNSSIFVYLNGSNVKQGEKAVHFTNFNVKADRETISLSYESDQTSNYSDEAFSNELFYEINVDKNYETIKLFNNGEETHFGSISGN